MRSGEGGFEPSVQLPVQRFSRLTHSPAPTLENTAFPLSRPLLRRCAYAYPAPLRALAMISAWRMPANPCRPRTRPGHGSTAALVEVRRGSGVVLVRA